MDERDAAQAAAELDASADLIFPFIARLDALIRFIEEGGDILAATTPSEFRIRIDDIYHAISSGERTFLRYLPLYPSLRDEWISGTLTQLKMTTTEGHRIVMAEKHSVLRKCAAIVRAKAGLPTPPPSPSSHYYFGGVHVGDKYEAKQAGAMGPGAHAHDMVFQQVWQQAADSINLSDLAADLRKLRQELRLSATEPEHDVAIGEIAAAETAARAGHGQKVFEHLRKAGSWVGDVATKIGVALATEALKTAIGLPPKGA
jgi:hypothetical protein